MDDVERARVKRGLNAGGSGNGDVEQFVPRVLVGARSRAKAGVPVPNKRRKQTQVGREGCTAAILHPGIDPQALAATKGDLRDLPGLRTREQWDRLVRVVHRVLHALRQNASTTIFLATHRREDLALADAVIWLQQGSVACTKSPQELLSDKAFSDWWADASKKKAGDS